VRDPICSFERSVHSAAPINISMHQPYALCVVDWSAVGQDESESTHLAFLFLLARCIIPISSGHGCTYVHHSEIEEVIELVYLLDDRLESPDSRTVFTKAVMSTDDSLCNDWV